MKRWLAPGRMLPLVVAAAVALAPLWLSAAERRAKPRPGQFNPDHQSVDMFEAIEAGQLEVKFIPKDSTGARVFIRNKTEQPLNVALPEAFVAMPVLAQFGAGLGAGMGGDPFGGGGGLGGGTQGLGGGFGGQQGGLGAGGGQNFFNVPAERVGEVKVPCVCLEHGKKDPRPHIPYEIKPVSTFSNDPVLAEFLKLFGQGRVDQRSAQAAAWHISSKMSWQELAAKRVEHIGGVSYPWFNRRELLTAAQMTQLAAQAAEGRQPASPGEQAALDLRR